MSETDPLRDIHSAEFREHSLAYFDRDIWRMNELLANLPLNSPEAIAIKQLGDFLVAVAIHQEKMLMQLAQETALPLKRPRGKPRKVPDNVIRIREEP